MTNFANLPLGQQIDWLSGKYYGMVWLGLASAAYTSEGKKDPWQITLDMQTAFDPANGYLPPLPELGQENAGYPGSPSLKTVPGSWRLDWGPAIAGDNSNLVYIASYRKPNGDPYFFVVGIRGTDTCPDELDNFGFGLLNQLAQDLKAFKLQPWDTYLTKGISKDDITTIGPPPNPTGQGIDDAPDGGVANGTMEGLDKIANLLPAQPENHGGAMLLKPIAETLMSLVGSNEYPVIVTGHSLGGCQTQVMASYLQWQFPNCAVIPQPFAPPTAGDDTFIDQGLFNRGQFWVNQLDLVPYAYGTYFDNGEVVADGDKLALVWAKDHLWKDDLWPDTRDHGPDLPDAISIAINTAVATGLNDDLKNKSYARPWSRVVTMPPATDPQTGKYLLPDVAYVEALLKAVHIGNVDPRGSLAQLLWQHFPPCYQIRLWECCRADLVYYDYKSVS
jgi:hypothetical protein